jgi:hypothetical protein
VDVRARDCLREEVGVLGRDGVVVEPLEDMDRGSGRQAFPQVCRELEFVAGPATVTDECVARRTMAPSTVSGAPTASVWTRIAPPTE